MDDRTKAAWVSPMILVSIVMILRIFVAGILQSKAAALGQNVLPSDWQWWTPEMQNNYTQAIQATRGPVFIFIIPMITSLTKLWLGWLIFSGLLHLLSTMIGGRGSMKSMVKLSAWALIPFAVRDILRIIYMIISGHPMINPGLSGFSSSLFVSKTLASVDIFIVWYLYLLVVGIRILDKLSTGRALVSALIVLLFTLLLQGGVGAAGASLSSMMITRPFF